MVSTPVENNFVTRFLLGLAVIVAMFVGAEAVGRLFTRLDVPYGTNLGVLVGALLVFLAFAAWYTRYSRSVEAD
ncbi:hypothetical protein ACKVMT_11755 [Halobacteriales archaeon Cl-PHB]